MSNKFLRTNTQRRIVSRGFLVTVLFSVLGMTCSAQEIVDKWKYTLRKPNTGWESPSFDASAWQDGVGGFGTSDTPGARVGTIWEDNAIWLRKTFELKVLPANPVLWMHYDEDAEVFINGTSVVVVPGYSIKYGAIAIPEAKRAALKVGANIMAVRCNQKGGGQFIDVHLVDGDNIPTLPKPKRSSKPFQSELTTKWGGGVTAENAWTEYPRPQLQRAQWQNLNGHWDYAVTAVTQKEPPSNWTGKILVPYCLESKLGGVQYLLDASEALWYHRIFQAAAKSGTRQLLNFEAVDYRCEVFVNGKSVGKHQGGNTPFTLDVTDAIANGQNDLVVRVEDETEAFQLRGKQTLNARGIWYTQVSGIWQSVWLEQVSTSYIENLKIATDASSGTISVRPIVKGMGEVRVIVKEGDRVVVEGKGISEKIELKVPNAKLWTPSSPHLYNITATLVDSTGNTLDHVNSYAGIRSVGKIKDADGHWRFTLNGNVIFHWGPLDQGWWPDGLLTPPSDEAMLFDIEWLKSANFNMIRKHIKVEPRRYYYHCDRLGMMVWQDQVSGGINPAWTRLIENPKDADAAWPVVQHEQFMTEFEAMISELENHPSIVVWTPFNEAWGQHRTVEVGKWASKRDPSRLVNVASGGNFWPAGDVVDEHQYPHPGFPFELGAGGRFDGYIKVVGEFGGHGFPVKGHIWDVNRRNWGYGDLPKDEDEYKKRYVTSIEMLNKLRGQGIAAGVYTQTTDVEGEINGLMTYDRKVIKIPTEQLRAVHASLYQ